MAVFPDNLIFMRDIAKVFGVTHLPVVSISIEADTGTMPRIHIESLIDEESATKVMELLKLHDWVEVIEKGEVCDVDTG